MKLTTLLEEKGKKEETRGRRGEEGRKKAGRKDPGGLILQFSS
jgi:hypothetical protein